MKTYLLSFVTCILCNISIAQSPWIEWQKSIGGMDYDGIDSTIVQQTSDGGYIVVGGSKSNDGDVSGNHGSNWFLWERQYDFWIVKLNSSGAIVWQKSLGGRGEDIAYSVQQTSDGGYIVAGYNTSNDSDVSGHHGSLDSNNFSSHKADFWVVKLSDSGNIIWAKSLGGTSFDYGRSIQQTTDGGYIVVGSSASNDGDVTGHHASLYEASDYWVVKLNSSGDVVWQKSLGGSGIDYPTGVQQTVDGGYIIAGVSTSNDGDVSGHHGSTDGSDCWVVKLSSIGDIVWQKSLGGINSDYAYSIQITSDGGYVVAGSSDSNDGDISGNHGLSDFCIFKLSLSGDIVWQKSFGGTKEDVANSIQLTSDGGYIVAGSSYSQDGDVYSNYGARDFWVIKLNALGEILGQKTMGGTSDDGATSIQQTADGQYIVAGFSLSNNIDVTGNHGSGDIWVVKLNQQILSSNEIEIRPIITMLPNPSSSFVTFQDNLKSNNDFTYKIVDLSGKIIKSDYSKFGEKINIQSLKNGNYIIQIENKNGEIKIEKLIKN